ncbi:asparagine synthase (glutamine-hydrolyzing) [Kibdelosporangium banguiense]|uniref:asparagine synthase (glutamine-hydrolyzing) n=1 Tax=Kibdelosporangium banguiense TaxID=1365924 RepID=A0ABS4TC00_9PSEU|nr:asparagine synthase (glutamine-hydrolyzing) [Kibdelosporangium banguiense]MBP2321590.1 asparagine synthase (glutamine-hydrolyzing) [Kibdelosporangium banguiense]
MCGIAGWVSFSTDLTQRREVIEAMTETMACRGPDDSGTWVRPDVALGHRRLAIIDLPGGRQPMAGAGLAAMVYSGEVYNFAELREKLSQRGHRFETDSDTEVVLRGYLEWGDAVADHLNGMYAFAIWDERQKKLVLIRDRMGVKPIYYYPIPDGVLFGSEPKAIFANPLARKVVGSDGLRELMTYTKAPGWSLWKGMHEVGPGTILTMDRSGIRTRTYWKLDAVRHTDDQETTVGRVRELMTDIVNRQLIADVPRCVLLSGGLDSSAITGLAAARLAEQSERLRTFSVDFFGQEENFRPDEVRDTPDSPFIRDVAKLVGSDHQDIVLDPAGLSDPDVRRKVLLARDIPAGLGDFDTSLYLLFKAIRQHSTVALSGESADEVFGGYRWFHNDAAVNSGTFPWLGRMSLTTDWSSLLREEVRATLDLPGYTADQYRTAIAQVDHCDGESEQDRKMRTICHLHLTRFVRILLDRKDRASMAVGLEVRVPFCDHRLVEYVYNTPWALKTFDGREKSLLRHATGHVLPASVRERVKSPYPLTQDPGYAAALQQQAKEVLTERNAPVFSLMDRGWLHRMSEVDPVTMSATQRIGIDRMLDLHHWFDLYSPELQLD